MDETAIEPQRDNFSPGAVMRQTFLVLRDNFASFMAVTAIVCIPLAVLIVALSATAGVAIGAADGALEIIEMVEGFVYLIIIVLFLVTYQVAAAALTYGTVQYRRGHSPTVSAMLRQIGPVLFPVLGVALVVTVIFAIGLALLVVPGLIAICVLYVALPVAVIERAGVGRSLRRSAELTKGSRWRIFALFLISSIVGQIIDGLGSAVGVSLGEMSGALWLGDLLSLPFTAVAVAWASVVLAVAYHDLRVLRDGVDTAQIAAVFD